MILRLIDRLTIALLRRPAVRAELDGHAAAGHRFDRAFTAFRTEEPRVGKTGPEIVIRLPDELMIVAPWSRPTPAPGSPGRPGHSRWLARWFGWLRGAR